LSSSYRPRFAKAKVRISADGIVILVSDRQIVLGGGDESESVMDLLLTKAAGLCFVRQWLSGRANRARFMAATCRSTR
jgi:hypothetical protein